MVTQGANTRNNKKGEKGESDGTKDVSNILFKKQTCDYALH